MEELKIENRKRVVKEICDKYGIPTNIKLENEEEKDNEYLREIKSNNI